MSTLAANPNIQYAVHTGTWINWSHGQIYGATLTLSRTDGNLLIAFVAFFVAFVGTRLWLDHHCPSIPTVVVRFANRIARRLLCFALHFLYSSQKREDGLYHQRQAVLRNSANPESGLLILLEMAWAWRRHPKHPLARLAVALLLVVICVIGFTLASGFSSKIATTSIAEALLDGSKCSIILSDAPMKSDITDVLTYYTPFISREVKNTANYAEQCYDGKSITEQLACTTFPKKMLPSVSMPNAPCPFNETICKTSDRNLIIDTGYLDSLEHFGLNFPETSRFKYRRVAHCAPLVTTGYTSTFNTTGGRQFTKYHYGERLDVENISHTYMAQSDVILDYRLTNHTGPTADYELGTFEAWYSNGSMLFAASTFKPVPELFIPDSDLYLFFLSAGRVLFVGNSTDPWYGANRQSRIQSFILTGEEGETSPAKYMFYQSEPASPLACTMREQFCSPHIPYGNCTPLTTVNDAYNLALLPMADTNPEEAERLQWALDAMWEFSPNLAVLPRILGGQALHSRNSLNQGVQGPIPGDQWQQDVQYWFNTALAAMQSAFIAAATGPTDPNILQFATTPNTTAQRSVCSNQKILTTAYVSFSVLRIALIFAIGGLVIAVSVILDPMMAFLRSRYSTKQYQQLEWCTNNTLQLQRLAHEELNVGTWELTTRPVPVTQFGELLSPLDLSDSKHPRLQPGSENDDPKKPGAKLGLVETITVVGDESSGSPSPVGTEAEVDEHREEHGPGTTTTRRSSGGSDTPRTPGQESTETNSVDPVYDGNGVPEADEYPHAS